MIWDESRRTVLHSDQRVLVLKRIAALRARSRADPSRDDKVRDSHKELLGMPALGYSKSIVSRHSDTLLVRITMNSAEIPISYPEQDHIRAGSTG